jgi:alkanesulfonate monooxygenase SsuD/methylene tetrahydromethanopterin reductase-like flavin-dependent oxidoreductase (luciferase family)
MTRSVLEPSPYIRLGPFGANTSGGAVFTTVPERWSGDWASNLALAKMAEAIGLDFLLPIARFKGFGGRSDFAGDVLDPVTLAGGLLAATRRITVFATVHTAFTHPVLAAKQFATVDAIGGGRFGLNVVCGWNGDEYEMFGLPLPPERDARYDHGEEWLTIIERIWAGGEPFDFDGTYFQLKGVSGRPGPIGGKLPLVNAGVSPRGYDFAVRYSDILFTGMSQPEAAAEKIAAHKALAATYGKTGQVMASSHVVCRPTRKEAQDYLHYYAVENGDPEGVNHLMSAMNISANAMPPDVFADLKMRFAAGGYGAMLLVGTPDDVTDWIERIAKAGCSGLTLGFVNWLNELPYFAQEVLPRLQKRGVRAPDLVSA